MIDPFRELELLEKLAISAADAPSVLADGVCRLFRPARRWCCRPPRSRRPVDGVARSSAAPEIGTLAAPWWPPQPGPAAGRRGGLGAGGWASLDTELAVVPLGRNAILVGRPALRWLASEIIRLSHLASIAATVLDPHPA